jgi:hypothetical protein
MGGVYMLMGVFPRSRLHGVWVVTGAARNLSGRQHQYDTHFSLSVTTYVVICRLELLSSLHVVLIYSDD